MKKIAMESKNIIEDNIDKIKELFPNVVVNYNGRDYIDFDVLKEELGDNISLEKEKYQLNWPGKKEVLYEANTSTTKTLLPDITKSIDFYNTKNIYIEGDNLQVLKILQESYLNKIGIIYIDPPYNTGNDFIYKDKYYKNNFEEEIDSGLRDFDNNRLVANNKTNGRFHSDWLSMMYPRLKLARNLLDNKGIMFISVDDNEVFNLKIICDEIFGINNFIACCTRISKRTSNKGNFFKPTKDYVLVYAKSINNINWKFGVSNKISLKDFKYEDEYGKYKKNGASLYQPSLESRPNQRYYIECPDGSLIIPPGNVFPNKLKDGAKVKPKNNNDKCWRWSLDTYLKNKDKLIFTKASTNCPLVDSNGKPAKWNVYDKVYLNDKIDETLLPEDVIYEFVNSQGTKEILSLDLNFSFAKPVGLIKYLISLTKLPNDITVLDFFSGSGTTAQAIMELNSSDNGKRKYIMVQLPEELGEETKRKNICELAEDRLKNAAKKIKKETKAKIDYGFRVYKVDSSNMKDNFYLRADELKQEELRLFETNIKENRNEYDLLIQVMLNLGLTIDLKIEEKNISSNKVFIVEDNLLVACFDDILDYSIIDKISKLKPKKVVFKESSFKTDNDKINLEEKFKRLSPQTEINVL